MSNIDPFVPGPSVSYARAEALEEEPTELCAQLDAGSHRLLGLILEPNRVGPWGAWGLSSCAHWLNWKVGLSLTAAREKLRVAHALQNLPLIREAFNNGGLSYSKVRAITRVATPENEEHRLMIGQPGTAVYVETLLRVYRGV